MLRSVDKEKATGFFFLTPPQRESPTKQTRNLLVNLRNVSSTETMSRNVSRRTTPTDNFRTAPPLSEIQVEPTKQREPSSDVYPGAEAYVDISHNVGGISRLLSIGRENDDNLSTLETETRNNIRRVVFQVLTRCQLNKI